MSNDVHMHHALSHIFLTSVKKLIMYVWYIKQKVASERSRLSLFCAIPYALMVARADLQCLHLNVLGIVGALVAHLRYVKSLALRLKHFLAHLHAPTRVDSATAQMLFPLTAFTPCSWEYHRCTYALSITPFQGGNHDPIDSRTKYQGSSKALEVSKDSGIKF